MRALLVASAVFVGACAAIAGLAEPTDLLAVADDSGGAPDAPPAVVDAASEQPAPPLDATADANDAAPKRPALCDEDGLVAHWRLDEGAGLVAYDCTSAKLDGTIVGAVWSAGKVGSSALDFTGDTVDAGNPTAFQITAGLSLTAWIRATAGSTTSGRIVSKSSQSDRGWELNIQSGTTLEFKIATGTSSYTQVSTSFTPDGQWHHVAGVYAPAGDAMRLYIDGAQAASITGVASSQRDAPFPVHIGAQPAETCCKFQGLIDDVRIYKRGITAAEVQAVMNAQ